MFTHAIDLACTNSWLEYKSKCTTLEIPKKKIMDLISFGMYIAEFLIHAGNTSKKRVGQPSGSSSPSEPSTPPTNKKSIMEVRPINEIRFDNVDHLPIFDETKEGARCKNNKCSKKTHFICKKCNVHLCITRDRNCYKDFHSK